MSKELIKEENATRSQGQEMSQASGLVLNR